MVRRLVAVLSGGIIVSILVFSLALIDLDVIYNPLFWISFIALLLAVGVYIWRHAHLEEAHPPAHLK